VQPHEHNAIVTVDAPQMRELDEMQNAVPVARLGSSIEHQRCSS
jgi:hypothetical protein